MIHSTAINTDKLSNHKGEQQMLKQIKNFLIMTLSITIMAIGVYYFKFPNNFTFGGVTGAAVVLQK